MKRTALSLFTSGGLGDLAVRQAGFDILVSNEKLEDRHALFAHNFPSTCAITGDIWEHSGRIESETRQRLGGRNLHLLYATPPCQGMSKNGRGKLLSAVRAGRKPPLDERNRLIVPMQLDAHRDDPLGDLLLTETDFAWVTKLIVAAADQHADGRVVSVLEGGYDLDALARSAAAHVAALGGR